MNEGGDVVNGVLHYNPLDIGILFDDLLSWRAFVEETGDFFVLRDFFGDALLFDFFENGGGVLG